jgi:hypothetical protein
MLIGIPESRHRGGSDSPLLAESCVIIPTTPGVLGCVTGWLPRTRGLLLRLLLDFEDDTIRDGVVNNSACKGGQGCGSFAVAVHYLALREPSRLLNRNGL